MEAGLARHGAFYPHGSAVHYARRKGPPWLERSWIESVVCAPTGRRVYDPAAYPRVFGLGMPPERVAWMERRIRAGHRGPDPLDDLIRRAGAVLVTTPLGFRPQEVPGMPFETHRSGWLPWDFTGRYRVRRWRLFPGHRTRHLRLPRMWQLLVLLSARDEGPLKRATARPRIARHRRCG